MSDDTGHVYLPISGEVMRLPLYVIGVGAEQVKSNTIYPTKSHPLLYQFLWKTGRVLPEYQLLYIQKGKGVFESKYTGRIQLNRGSMVMIYPDLWHRYRPDKQTGWNEFWVSINGGLLHDLQAEGVSLPEACHKLISSSYMNEVESIYNEIRYLAIKYQHQYPINMLPLIMRLIGHMLEAKDDNSDRVNHAKVPENEWGCNVKDPIVQGAVKVIWNHSHRQINVAQIAEYLPVTRRTLERKFREVMGRTVLEELTRCRFLRASRFLKETHMPVKQIALITGFSGLGHMDRVFMRIIGQSPTIYRSGEGNADI
ncbi:HTH-type transcriptional activator Btr [Poriferisphaera corsica]|uniref:HTH-type transcriptional activator Btr n=1 Tax=Poriferisphaera corsica TaxID=2528020 RepID=A0A517YS09_9BACT|nr:AraC family transcriptional regulator [Poriferisphaera corsica]QDU33017.1 HTH-type transcriptional activator Btr [Poriferisphaera corsica]